MRKERREQERKEIPIAFAYSFNAEGGPNSHCNTAFTINVSSKGISFYTVEPLKVGDEIRFFSDYFHTNTGIGVVKWVKLIIASTWQVGVMFKGEDTLCAKSK